MTDGVKASERSDESTHLSFHRINSVTQILVSIAKYGCWAFIGFHFFNAIRAFAGTTTDASIVVKYLSGESSGVTISLSITLNVGLMLLVARERRLRKDNIKRLANAKNDLERRLDPTRSSSGLSPDGATAPHDK